MLSTLELFIHGFVAFALLPLAVVSLATGSKPPEAPVMLAKYYRADKRLMLVSNVFLLTLAATAIGRLLEHFGLLGEASTVTMRMWIDIPFFVMLVVFLAMLFNAWLKVRRGGEDNGADPKAG